MNTVQPIQATNVLAPTWQQAAAATTTVWVDPVTGASVDSWGNPVAMTPATVGWSSPVTSWSPAPSADAAQGAVSVGSGSMLDAIANAMLGIPTTATGAIAPAAASTTAASSTTVGAAVTAAPAHAQTLAKRARAATAATAATAAHGFSAATGHAGRVARTAVRGAKRVGGEIWAGVKNPRSIHVSQVPSKYNSSPAPGNQDCGPVSVVMSLKLLGLSIPGIAQGAAPQKLVNRVRQMSGNVLNTVATSNHELERALKGAGARVRELSQFQAIRASVLAGKPVILNGNPRNPGSYGPRYSASQMVPFDGAHWILVSGYDSKTGQFIVNDPLSKIGPVKVSPTQLEAYRGGSIGIEVAR